MGNPFRAKRRNPKRRSGSKGTTPSGAGARLAKWRWHHNPSSQPYEYTVERVPISRIAPGDVIQCPDGHHRTVGRKDIKIGGLFGRTLFGDSYRAGHLLVERVIIKRAKRQNPGWESAYPAHIVKAGRIATMAGIDSMGSDEALREAGAPVTKANLRHLADYLQDAEMMVGRNPGRYARLDAKAVAKARLNIRSGGQPHTVWDAVRTQSAAGRARRTLTYGQRSRLSKRIAFEYQKAIKAGKRRRSR